MELKIYNTLSRKKELFKPIHENRVKMFVCGPTTYDLSHLGHARTYISYDIIARYLRYQGYSVFYVMNITDVDDKIINQAEKLGTSPIELAREFERQFHEDMFALGIQSVNLFARASEHIPEIIKQVKTLIDKGYAYETETGVYYDITKFKDLGTLSHQKPSELTKHRVDPDPTKKNVQDFALWKKRGPKKVGWDSPWGRGRPGWHIEDTAITTHYLGPQYDIHGGAIELMFPHHEAEIAQAEAATGKKPLVKYWVHTGVLKINGKKMSKSLGNFITIKDALKTYDSEILRFFFASTHYRSTKDFREKSLEQAKKNLQTLYTALDKIRRLTHKEEDEADEFEMEKVLIETRAIFIEAMDNDFNSPSAIKILFDLAKEVNKFADTHKSISNKLLETILKTFKELGEIFNILQKEEQAIDTGTLKNIVNLIIELRDKFRESKNWETSDMLRSKLKEAGITIEDSEKGTIWKRTE